LKLRSLRITGTITLPGESIGRDRFEAPTPLEVLANGWVQVGPFVVPPGRVLEGIPESTNRAAKRSVKRTSE
jgi:hypothetical protein